jgi:anti-sigma factor RsiW
MNWEKQLELQAWVDGELSPADARRVAAVVESDAAASALAEELRMTKTFVSANEPEVKLADTREFYWSQIRRQIESSEMAPGASASFSWQSLWHRIATPVTGLALVAVLALGSFNLLRQPGLDSLPGSQLVEVEDLSEDISSISYHSQSENMFVVYVYSKDSGEQGDTTSETFGDDFLQ